MKKLPFISLCIIALLAFAILAPNALAVPECTDDAECDDGLFCSGFEYCDTGTCFSGTPPDCDDGVGCTVDTCDEVNDTCVNTPDDASCDDGNVCNGAETCDGVSDCQSGTPLECDDADLCTDDSCDPIGGCANDLVECPAGEQCDQADGVCKPIIVGMTICHIPPGNPRKARTLSINADSVADHLAHGDFLGPCP